VGYIGARPKNETGYRQNELHAEARRLAAHRRYHVFPGRWEVEFVNELESKFNKPIAG
jgi:hypothetical protein